MSVETVWNACEELVYLLILYISTRFNLNTCNSLIKKNNFNVVTVIRKSKKKNIVGAVCYPYVISRCGIFNGQTSDLPHHSHTNITTHTPNAYFSPLPVSLSISRTHKFTNIHCCTVSPLTPLPQECNTNKLYICMAS